MMKFPPKERLSPWRVAGFVAFIVVVALFQLVSSRAGMMGVGIMVLAGALPQMVTRRIPYGWEGREPSGYITGIPAVLLSLLICAAGLAMLLQPEFMLALLGWSSKRD
jgi:hypothetical protein